VTRHLALHKSSGIDVCHLVVLVLLSREALADGGVVHEVGEDVHVV
jgi:hypothetical protein